jgi:hypothetical protein
LDCSAPKFKPYLTGKKRSKPARLFEMFVFGYELDLLEMRLWEYDGMMDTTFLLEQPVTHRGQRKAMFFEHARSRFAKFLDRIVHFVEDDAAVWKKMLSPKNLT